MSVRSYSFREGDRSEYLAQFLLSALGLCSPIPRQEDVGYDFSCSIANQESGLISFGYPYLISIKSQSRKKILIKAPKSAIKENDNSPYFAALFPGQPTFLGLVNKNTVTLTFYSLLPLWFLYYRGGPTIGSITLLPRISAEQGVNVDRPIQGPELPEWPGHFHFTVDLGHPVAQMSVDTLKTKPAIAAVKHRLRYVIDYAERTIVHQRLDVPYHYWVPITTPDSSECGIGFSCDPVYNHPDNPKIMANLVPSLITFALHYKEVGNAELFEACRRLIMFAPPNAVPEAILRICWHGGTGMRPGFHPF